MKRAALWHTYLLFSSKGTAYGINCYLLMEVSLRQTPYHNQLIERSQLGRRKLPEKQVRHCRKGIFHIMAICTNASLKSGEWIETCRGFSPPVHGCPAKRRVYQTAVSRPSVNLHQCPDGDGLYGLFSSRPDSETCSSHSRIA